ncbi:hypothetical protein HG531_011672 [Fusarium graminearum]|nr:hypothetical protein HG531_011672 [Fusarium graminearum]
MLRLVSKTSSYVRLPDPEREASGCHLTVETTSLAKEANFAFRIASNQAHDYCFFFTTLKAVNAAELDTRKLVFEWSQDGKLSIVPSLFVRRKAHNTLVHAILCGQHSFDGGSMQRQQSVKQSNFERGTLCDFDALFDWCLDLGIGRLYSWGELQMITSTDNLFSRYERNPTLSLKSLAGLIDDNDIKLFVSQLVASCSMQCRKDNLTTANEGTNTPAFSLAKFFP